MATAHPPTTYSADAQATIIALAGLLVCILAAAWYLRLAPRLARRLAPRVALKRDIFLSYAWGPAECVEGRPEWALQKKALRLHDLLVKKGFTVWLDVQQMPTQATGEGGLGQAMREGIADASVVLICVSRHYVTSKNCKLEAQYAKDRKPGAMYYCNLEPEYSPSQDEDQWLYELMRDAYWFSCSERGLADLLRALSERLCPGGATIPPELVYSAVENLRRLNAANAEDLLAAREEVAVSEHEDKTYHPLGAFLRAKKSNLVHALDEYCCAANYAPQRRVGKWLVFGGNEKESPKDIEALWLKVKAATEQMDFPGSTPILFAKIGRKSKDNPCLMVFSVEGQPKEDARLWLIRECCVPEAELCHIASPGRWKPEALTEAGHFSREDVLGQGGLPRAAR